ncbi:MAG: N-acetylglucosamine kinase [Acidobacteriaceae bacterium]
MSFFLAVDAGGTKTDYALADDSRELARVRGGTIKRLRADADTAARNLDQALAELAARAGVPMNAITRTCVGAAGESVPLVADWLRDAFSARVSGGLLLLGDVEIALDAAFPGQPGILALAGTGSNVAGRSQTGQLTNAGGWGPALADQGSGHRIGSEGLRAAFLAIDEATGQMAQKQMPQEGEAAQKEEREAPTLLLPAIMHFWSLASIDHLIEYANSVPAPDFSRLTSVVLACATQGDAVALSVLKQEGEDLAHLVNLVARRLQQLAPDPSWVPPLAFAGGILEKVAPLRQALVAAVRAEFPSIQVREGVVDPIAGAIWRARANPPA